MAFRKEVINKHARMSPAAQINLMRQCKSSLLFWINTFVFTERIQFNLPDGRVVPVGGGIYYSPRENGDGWRMTSMLSEALQWRDQGYVVRYVDPAVPMITWPYQDEALLKIEWCVNNGKQFLVDKFRDAGASWMCLLVFHHQWLFHDHSLFLEVSRVENLVDEIGNAKALFSKHDFVNMHLPTWMLPCNRKDLQTGGKYRKHLLIRNPKNGSQIAGESTTGNVGQGDRRKAVLLDEFARVENGANMLKAVRAVAPCVGMNSTPEGVGTEFSQTKKRAESKRQDVVLITLDYFNHPEKGYRRKWAIDEDGTITGVAGRGFYNTPWLENEVARAGGNIIEIAENIFHDHTQAGDVFFNHNIVEQHRRVYSTTPVRYKLVETSDPANAHFVGAPGDGQWFVFWDQVRNGRFPTNTNYLIGIDVSRGTGSSNSVMAVMDSETGMIVAEFVSPFINPEALTELACYVGQHVFGGQHGHAFIVWETNGPGEGMYKEFERLAYPLLYYQEDVGKNKAEPTRRYGWHSTRASKQVALGQLGVTLTRNETIIRSDPGLDEMLAYEYFDDGSLGAALTRDMLSGARESHGDRVIAYAMAVLGRRTAPKFMKALEQFAPGTMGKVAGHDEPEVIKGQLKSPFKTRSKKSKKNKKGRRR